MTVVNVPHTPDKLRLEAGMLVMVRFGHSGTQLARLLRYTGTHWAAEKWRATSRRWTGLVHVQRSDVLRLPTNQDVKRVHMD